MLTDEGLAARERTWPAYANAIVEHFTDHLSAEETHLLTQTLTRVLRNSSIAVPNTAP